MISAIFAFISLLRLVIHDGNCFDFVSLDLNATSQWSTSCQIKLHAPSTFRCKHVRRTDESRCVPRHFRLRKKMRGRCMITTEWSVCVCHSGVAFRASVVVKSAGEATNQANAEDCNTYRRQLLLPHSFDTCEWVWPGRNHINFHTGSCKSATWPVMIWPETSPPPTGDDRPQPL